MWRKHGWRRSSGALDSGSDVMISGNRGAALPGAGPSGCTGGPVSLPRGRRGDLWPLLGEWKADSMMRAAESCVGACLGEASVHRAAACSRDPSPWSSHTTARRPASESRLCRAHWRLSSLPYLLRLPGGGWGGAWLVVQILKGWSSAWHGVSSL